MEVDLGVRKCGGGGGGGEGKVQQTGVRGLNGRWGCAAWRQGSG